MIIDGQETLDQRKTANCFNKFFVDIGPKLASMISEPQTKLVKPYWWWSKRGLKKFNA